MRTATPGYIGPEAIEDWLKMAHGETPIACHETIKAKEDRETTWKAQCAGAAIFRSNIHKSPRDPEIETLPRDDELVFSWDDEFVAHHDLRPRMMELRKWMLQEWSGAPYGQTKKELVEVILGWGSKHHYETLLDYEHMMREP